MGGTAMNDVFIPVALTLVVVIFIAMVGFVKLLQSQQPGRENNE